MNKIVNAILLFGLVLGIAQAEEEIMPPSLDGATTISAEELIDLVDEHEDLVIIDARKPSDRDKGYIEGSIGLVDTDTTPETLANHIPSTSTPIVFYCNGIKCGRSAKSTNVAVADGYSNIYWFRGGWEEWSSKGYPVAR